MLPKNQSAPAVRLMCPSGKRYGKCELYAKTPCIVIVGRSGRRLERVDEHRRDIKTGLLRDFAAADGAVRNADAGIEQAQIVVNFSYGPDGRTRVFGSGLLVD